MQDPMRKILSMMPGASDYTEQRGQLAVVMVLNVWPASCIHEEAALTDHPRNGHWQHPPAFAQGLWTTAPTLLDGQGVGSQSVHQGAQEAA